MASSFTPVPRKSIDPRLLPHLDPGETLVWQGAPEITPAAHKLGFLFCGLSVLAGLGLLAGLGPMFFPSLALAGPTTLVPGLVLVGFGVLMGFQLWGERGANWRYALSDRRALVVRGNKPYRAALPAELRDIRTSGSKVYWAVETTGTKERNRRYIGFNHMRDSAATKQLLEAWRDWKTDHINADAARFTERMQQGGAAVEEGIVRVVHPGTGLTIDVPAGWTITVSLDHDGPLILFGVTLLKRMIRPGTERPYGSAGDWNVLRVRAEADTGLYMVIRQEPLTRTLDEVLGDPWNERLGLEILQSKADLEIGSFRGFSVARRMPEGGNVIGFGPVQSEALSRTIWLGDGGTSVEFTGLARADQPDVQSAVNVMVESLSQQR